MPPSDPASSGSESFDGNTPSPGDHLANLRSAIDEIDDRFVKLLAERFAVTREVGQLKADLGMPAIDATREDQVDEKARRLANANGLDADLVSEVLRSIIDRVVAEHRTIADNVAQSTNGSNVAQSTNGSNVAQSTNGSNVAQSTNGSNVAQTESETGSGESSGE